MPGTSLHILVTGGAGFIGSHLTERLLAQGCSVTVIDDLSTGRLENLSASRGDTRLRFLSGSVASQLPILSAQRIDQIYHLAAAVGVRLILDRPIRTIETNVDETAALLRFAGQRRIPTLIASSSEVYGKSTRIPFSEDDDVIFGPTSLSRWSYAYTKAIDEYLALAYHRERELPVVVARFFNTVGPRQVGQYGMVLPRFIAAALAGRPIQVYGDGSQVRCFCDVRDVVTALPTLLASSTACGRVFNVGNDQPVSILELAHLVKSTLASSSDIEMIAYRDAYGAGFEDLAARQPNLNRLRAEIGFAPAISLTQTIRDIAAHLQSSGTLPALSKEEVGGSRP